jgi:hypothetical protein
VVRVVGRRLVDGLVSLEPVKPDVSLGGGIRSVSLRTAAGLCIVDAVVNEVVDDLLVTPY